MRMTSIRYSILRRLEGEEHYIRHKSVSYDLIMIVMTVVFMVRKISRRVFGRARRRGPAPGATA